MKASQITNLYNQTLEVVHYNPYLFIEKEKYRDAMNSVKNSLPDSISLQGFIQKLYNLTSLLKDSHTSPYIVQTAIVTDLRKEIFFSYQMIIDRQRIYVPVSTAAVSGIPSGSEIISINHLKNL